MRMALSKKNFIILWLPVFLYAGAIFYLSSIPQVPLPISFPFLDKLIHIAEYAILGLLLARAIKKTYSFASFKKLCLLIAGIAFVYGLSDEFHQAFVPGRMVSLGDALFDGLGGWLGALIYR